MNNNTKLRNSKEVTIQLKRAEIQKNVLIRNIYKEYEIYFRIVRKYLLTSAEEGISSLYSDLFISDRVLNSKELNNFLKKNINPLIKAKLPLITIEQLKLGDISYPQKQLVNENDFKDLIEFKEYQTFFIDYENELIPKENLEFYCNDNSNTYEHYVSLSEDQLSSLNLDQSGFLNPYFKENNLQKIDNERYIDGSGVELVEKNDNKLNNYEKINYQASDVFISSENLNIFELIDKSFSDFLLNLSYEINSELLKIDLIKKFISKVSFKFLSNNNYKIKHLYPFVIGYDSNQNNLSIDNNKSYDIYLFNITNVELEFYSLDLSRCRNNINKLKNRFRILNKKERYWKHKELTLNNIN